MYELDPESYVKNSKMIKETKSFLQEYDNL